MNQRVTCLFVTGFEKIHLPLTQQQVLFQTIAVQQFGQALVLKVAQAAFTICF